MAPEYTKFLIFYWGWGVARQLNHFYIYSSEHQNSILGISLPWIALKSLLDTRFYSKYVSCDILKEAAIWHLNYSLQESPKTISVEYVRARVIISDI